MTYLKAAVVAAVCLTGLEAAQVRVSAQSPAIWQLVQELPSALRITDIAVYGDTLVTGHSKGIEEPGVAFVYKRLANGRWQFLQSIGSPYQFASHSPVRGAATFGSQVDVSRDYIVASVPLLGSVHVFQRSLSGWSHMTALTARGSGSDLAVAVESDRIVFARGGVVQVFERAGSLWVEKKLVMLHDASPVNSIDLYRSRFIVGQPTSASVYALTGSGWAREDVIGFATVDSTREVALDGSTAVVSDLENASVFKPYMRDWLEVGMFAPPSGEVGAVAVSNGVVALAGEGFAAYDCPSSCERLGLPVIIGEGWSSQTQSKVALMLDGQFPVVFMQGDVGVAIFRLSDPGSK